MSELHGAKAQTGNALTPSTPAKRSGSSTRGTGAIPGRNAPLGLKSPAASRDAKQIAAAVLEVLAGVRTPADAAASLAISLPRYYQLESRAFQGLVASCEPRPLGRQSTAEHQLVSLRRELERLRREHGRQQALVRAAQRTIGLSFPEKPHAAGKNASGSKAKRVRRPTARALKAVWALRCDAEEQALEHSAQEATPPPVLASLAIPATTAAVATPRGG